jgi:hypothetical protein
MKTIGVVGVLDRRRVLLSDLGSERRRACGAIVAALVS